MTAKIIGTRDHFEYCAHGLDLPTLMESCLKVGLSGDIVSTRRAIIDSHGTINGPIFIDGELYWRNECKRIAYKIYVSQNKKNHFVMIKYSSPPLQKTDAANFNPLTFRQPPRHFSDPFRGDSNCINFSPDALNKMVNHISADFLKGSPISIGFNGTHTKDFQIFVDKNALVVSKREDVYLLAPCGWTKLKKDNVMDYLKALNAEHRFEFLIKAALENSPHTNLSTMDFSKGYTPEIVSALTMKTLSAGSFER